MKKKTYFVACDGSFSAWPQPETKDIRIDVGDGELHLSADDARDLIKALEAAIVELEGHAK